MSNRMRKAHGAFKKMAKKGWGRKKLKKALDRPVN